MKATKQTAFQHVHALFHLAQEVIHENPRLTQKYVDMAKKIAMRTRIHLPREYRRLICKHCKHFIMPGVNCRVRIQPKREPHLVITCLECMQCTRIPFRKK